MFNAIILTSKGEKKVTKYFPLPAKRRFFICQILRRLISQYCTMDILIRNGGDGGRGGGGTPGFLIKPVYLVSPPRPPSQKREDEMKTASPPAGDGGGDGGW